VTGSEFRAVRYRLGLSAMEWGRALGYGGTPNSVRSVISRLESGSRPVPAVVGLLAWMYGRYGIPGDGTPLDGNRRDGGRRSESQESGEEI
jgi:hypothetical protein